MSQMKMKTKTTSRQATTRQVATRNTPTRNADSHGAAIHSAAPILEMDPISQAFPANDTSLTGIGLLSPIMNWIRSRRTQAVQSGKLRVTETISLGDKRFVSVIHVDGHRYLIGGSASNVALLTQLDTPVAPFGEALRRASATPRKRATPATKAKQVAQ